MRLFYYQTNGILGLLQGPYLPIFSLLVKAHYQRRIAINFTRSVQLRSFS
ncbi:Uncharacterised protein [Serratia fonticola]|uniref:Uncharacterized protein n=1 Tax=Serratia fonticola TaxID=47917 RepID=A0A4U9WC24_SERFO|nr:Uncharacterised protein [Serratia fonticola]